MELVTTFAGVLALIFAVAWVFKRLQTPGMTKGKLMHVVATLPLGPKDRILLVDVGGRQVLMGVSASGIRSLHVFDEPVSMSPPLDPTELSFAENLRNLLTRAQA